jgi:hypothetical protein
MIFFRATQHPPMHHPKSFVYQLFGWDETQPKLKTNGVNNAQINVLYVDRNLI